MSLSLVQRSPSSSREWDARVDAEARHQARIEAAFDRAEACELTGDLGHALEALGEAADLSGGLPPAYRLMADSWSRQLARKELR